MHFSSRLITLKVQKVISQPKYFMHECSLYGTNLEADVMLLTKAQFQFNILILQTLENKNVMYC